MLLKNRGRIGEVGPLASKVTYFANGPIRTLGEGAQGRSCAARRGNGYRLLRSARWQTKTKGDPTHGTSKAKPSEAPFWRRADRWC